jgi:glycosyltransferase involved in cell wall biosynthesis
VIRVAVDATPLLSDLTGIGVFTAGALRALTAHDDLDLLGYAVTWRGQRRLRQLLPAGVRAGRVPMPARPLRELWRRRDGPAIEWFIGSTDVVHGTNYVVPPARRAAEVVTIADLTFLRYPELCEPATLHYYPASIQRALARGAMVHAMSHAVAGEVVDLLGAHPDQVRVVYLGLDPPPPPPAPHPPPPAPEATAGADVSRNQRPYILALGKAEPRKDVPRLIEAFDSIAGNHLDLDLVIAGPPGWGETSLTAAIDRARHSERIQRLGWLSPERRSALLANALVFAYPSVYEGFGLPPLEAMSAGVPVVATAASAVAEIAGDGARLVPVGDTEALAAALSAVVDDPVERSRLVEAGRRRAAEFSWERCGAGLRQLYVDADARHRS